MLQARIDQLVELSRQITPWRQLRTPPGGGEAAAAGGAEGLTDEQPPSPQRPAELAGLEEEENMLILSLQSLQVEPSARRAGEDGIPFLTAREDSFAGRDACSLTPPAPPD